MEESANASVVASERGAENKKPPAMRRVLTSLALSAFLIAAAGGLEYANAFRNDRYQTGTGVQYPWWNEVVLSPNTYGRESYASDCADAAPDNVFCAMFAKLGTPQQSSNEVAVIKKTTLQDKSGSYCDSFYGACYPQPANVTLQEARQIFEYLGVAYLDPAAEDISRGRLASARTSIARIEYLLGPVDLPLGSQHCCFGSAGFYIVPAFLGDDASWRDRKFVQEVMALGTGGGEDSRYPTIAAYARGIGAGNRRCYRTAAAEFSRLGTADTSRRLRELGSYMALLSDFRARIYDPARCLESQPPALTDAQRQLLKEQVSRRGFLSDIAQMEATPSRGDAANAS